MQNSKSNAFFFAFFEKKWWPRRDFLGRSRVTAFRILLLCFQHNHKLLQPQLAPARTHTAFSSRIFYLNIKKLAPARFERAIFGLGNRCSILLSYEAKIYA